MPDKATSVILEALTRALLQPEGIPLFASKSEPGLFPPTTKAKALADRCREEGWIEIVRQEIRGKVNREIGILSEKGRMFLLEKSSPRQLLEDFLRVLESRQSDIVSMAGQLEQLQQMIRGMSQTLDQVLPRLTESTGISMKPSSGGSTMNGTIKTTVQPETGRLDLLIGEIKTRLSEWYANSATPQDCPLPELFRRMELKATIGEFHDALRQLHDDHQIYLHPWTGPLYALPEPAFALLVGHEIAFYASMR